jgi:hypothetical protein
MPGGLLNVFELRVVFERRRDEDGAHRVRRPAFKPMMFGSAEMK